MKEDAALEVVKHAAQGLGKKCLYAKNDAQKEERNAG